MFSFDRFHCINKKFFGKKENVKLMFFLNIVIKSGLLMFSVFRIRGQTTRRIVKSIRKSSTGLLNTREYNWMCQVEKMNEILQCKFSFV